MESHLQSLVFNHTLKSRIGTLPSLVVQVLQPMMPTLQALPLETLCHILDLAQVDAESTPPEENALVSYWYSKGMTWSPATLGTAHRL